MTADIIARVDHEIAEAERAKDTPVMLHLGERAYLDLLGAVKRQSTAERMACGSISIDQSVALQYRHLPCRQYEELPASFIVVIRDSAHTRTLMGLPEHRIAIPETSAGQSVLSRMSRRMGRR